MIKKNLATCYILLTFLLIIFHPVNVLSVVSTEDEETDAPVISPDSGKTAHSMPSGGFRKIPDSIVSISSGYVLVVDKKYQKIYVFRKSGTFTKVFESPCSTGKKSGDKQVAGDEKTPNGIFFATKILHNPGPPEIYGTMAFPLDYPTLSDKRDGKNGNNIWIHGTTKSLLPKQSSGCVVLRDGDLKRLANFIYLNRTPVVISESIKWVPQSYVPVSKNELENILISWNKAFVEKDLRKIDSLYMQGTEIKGKRREDLHNKIKNMKIINKHFDLQPRDISILQEGNNAVITFDQIFDVNSNNSFQGFYNKLILEKINNKWYVVDDTTPSAVSKTIALAKNNEKRSDGIDDPPQKEIRQLVNKWLTSWQSGDMESYRSCYAPDFTSREMDLDAWIIHKSTVRQKSENISIRIDNLQISADGDTAQASFIQQYSSSVLKSKGKKTLELRKIGDSWKIRREIM
ncbi:MAG: L,D-transpeptidase family protein [Deltaproteobacteria bacterium]|nr:L,D-transpeptidase family protein [Deltaproteobacteria bacterium]